MTDSYLVLDADAIDLFLGYLVDSQEKLEIVLCLYAHRARRPMTSAEIASAVPLPSQTVAEELADLYRAGLVATVHDDGAGWWLDDHSAWNEVLDVVVRLYRQDRRIVLRRMARVALRQLRANRQGTAAPVLRMRFKHDR